MKSLAPFLSFAVALLSTLAAHADTITFSATGNGFESSGTMTVVADPTAPGTLDVSPASRESEQGRHHGSAPGEL